MTLVVGLLAMLGFLMWTGSFGTRPLAILHGASHPCTVPTDVHRFG